MWLPHDEQPEFFFSNMEQHNLVKGKTKLFLKYLVNSLAGFVIAYILFSLTEKEYFKDGA